MRFRAWAAAAAGGPLAPYEYEPVPLGPHDCELEVSHCGVCHSDLHLLDDDWGVTRWPFVPGHEIVGIVRDAGADARALVGRRVAVGWQRSACLDCEQCRAGRENLCPRRQATCVGHHGGFADRVRVDSRFAFPLPDALDSASAAPLLCGGATVWSPLRRYGVGPGVRVGVLGIGGLGHLAIKFARALGAEVTALSSSPEKATDAARLGADTFVHATDEDAMRGTRRSLDLLVSTVFADQDWNAYLSLVAPHGTLCFVGEPPAPLGIPAGALVSGERSIAGSAIGSRARIAEMLVFCAERGIGADVEVLPLAQANDAMRRLKDGRARYRLVLAA